MRRLGRMFAFWSGLLGLCCVAPTWGAAQQLIVSKNADYATQDRTFSRADVLYIKIIAPHIDPATLKVNLYHLQAEHGGDEREGPFSNPQDGSFTAALSLAQTDPAESAWRLRVRIEDQDRGKIDARLNLTIVDPPKEEEDEEDAPAVDPSRLWAGSARLPEAGPSARTFTAQPVLAPQQEADAPSGFRLLPNYPNPFTAATTFVFEIDGDVPLPVRLRIFDMRGRVVHTVVTGTFARGTYRFQWTGRQANGVLVPRGVYVYRMEVGAAHQTRMLLRNR